MLGRLATGVLGWASAAVQAAMAVDDETLLDMVRCQAKRIGLRFGSDDCLVANRFRFGRDRIVKPIDSLAGGAGPVVCRRISLQALIHARSLAFNIRRYDLAGESALQRVDRSAPVLFNPAVWFVSPPSQHRTRETPVMTWAGGRLAASELRRRNWFAWPELFVGGSAIQ